MSDAQNSRSAVAAIVGFQRFLRPGGAMGTLIAMMPRVTVVSGVYQGGPVVAWNALARGNAVAVTS